MTGTKENQKPWKSKNGKNRGTVGIGEEWEL